MHPLRAAWIACGEPCSLADWCEAFAAWEVQPVVVAGEVVGAVLANGPEVHVAVLPHVRGRWCTPSLWRWAITDRQAKYGRLVTFGNADNAFITRAGFLPIESGDGIIAYQRC